MMPLRFNAKLLFSATTVLLATVLPARAEDAVTYEVTLTGEAFAPAEIEVPAGKAFIIKMKNTNPAPAEFEAKAMQIEKVVAGNSEIVVRVKALEPGKYLFVDEYHEDAAKGFVIAE
jgi:plastocyanin